MDQLIEDRELDCGDVGALLSGLIDDELPAEVRHAAERHMALCATCRTAMDQVERNEELMLASFEVAPALPAGFEDAVFAQTTRSLPLRFTQEKSRWFAVSGWLAAAAVLAFSAVIWTLNSNSGENLQLVNSGGDNGVIPVSMDRSSHYALPPEAVSSTSDARLVAKLPAGDESAGGANSGAGIALGIESAQGGAVVNTHRPMFFSGQGRLSPEDQQTLIQVANLLRMMLEDNGQNGFAVTERMRQMIETAELVTRLENVRENAPVQHRAMLLNVESILWKVSSGPIHEFDLRELRNIAESLDLTGELDRLSGNVIPNRSL